MVMRMMMMMMDISDQVYSYCNLGLYKYFVWFWVRSDVKLGNYNNLKKNAIVY